MTSPYKPQLGSLAQRVCTFLHTNRDEELSRVDIAQKFDCSPNSIDSAPEKALQNQILSRRNCADQGCMVFFAGPKMTEYDPGKAPMPPSPDRTASAAANTTLRTLGKQTRKRTQLPELDVDAIAVHYDRPLPDKAHPMRRGANKYAELLAKLDRVNASATLPVAYRGTLQKAVVKHTKDQPDSTAKWVVRTVDADTIGIWRTA